MSIIKMTIRNDIHLPAEIVKRLNVGQERAFWAVIKGNNVILTPVDLEPRYSHEALAGLEKLAQKEKNQAESLNSRKDIEELFP